MADDGLTPSQREILKDILRPFAQKIDKVGLFGSRATGLHRENSDIDLVIYGNLTEEDARRLWTLFDASVLAVKVDVHVYSLITYAPLKEHIDAVVKPLFSKKDWISLDDTNQSVTCEGKTIERDMVGLAIPNDHTVKVGEFCPFVYGKALPAHKRNGSGKFPVYGSSGIIGYHTEALTFGSTIIIGRKGTVGQVHFSKEPCWPIDTTFYIEESPNRDIRYAYYALQSLGLEYMNGDSAVPGLNRDHAHNQNLPDKTLSEQKAIAEVLGALDDKIELNRRMNQTLEAMAQALFKDWFVDFAPTRAKMAGKPAYLPQDIWDLFPNKLDDEGKPKGWNTVTLEKIISINPSETLKKGTAAPYLEMSSLSTDGSTTVPPIKRTFASGTKFRNGDTLLARITPCLENGKTAFVQCLDDGVVGWGSTEFIVLRSKSPIPSQFTYLLARDSTFRNYVIQSMTGTSGRQQAQNESIAAYPLLMPSVSIWRAFEGFVQPYFTHIQSNANQSIELEHLHDLLLPKLVSGNLIY